MFQFRRQRIVKRSNWLFIFLLSVLICGLNLFVTDTKGTGITVRIIEVPVLGK